MNKIKCYINSDYIDIKKNDINYHIKTKSINNGDIINSKLFNEELKNKKIFSNIFTNSIDIYLNHKIQEKDILYYKSIFEDLNCNNINLFDTSKKLTSATLINCSPIYILYFENKYYKVLPELINKMLSLKNITSIKIISDKDVNINNKIKCYYYNNSNTYFID